MAPGGVYHLGQPPKLTTMDESSVNFEPKPMGRQARDLDGRPARATQYGPMRTIEDYKTEQELSESEGDGEGIFFNTVGLVAGVGFLATTGLAIAGSVLAPITQVGGTLISTVVEPAVEVVVNTAVDFTIKAGQDIFDHGISLSQKGLDHSIGYAQNVFDDVFNVKDSEDSTFDEETVSQTPKGRPEAEHRTSFIRLGGVVPTVTPVREVAMSEEHTTTQDEIMEETQMTGFRDDVLPLLRGKRAGTLANHAKIAQRNLVQRQERKKAIEAKMPVIKTVNLPGAGVPFMHKYPEANQEYSYIIVRLSTFKKYQNWLRGASKLIPKNKKTAGRMTLNPFD